MFFLFGNTLLSVLRLICGIITREIIRWQRYYKMCFSATASFAGGVIISSIGVAAIRKNTEPSQRLFAAIPMMFGLQQICEGFVWYALQSPGHDMLLEAAAYIFLILALVGWPTFLPLSVLLMERSEQRRRALYVSLATGTAVSIYFAISMLIFKMTAQISSYHILYTVDYPRQFADLGAIAYIIATIPPLFVSSKRGMGLFGIIIVLSYCVTRFFYAEYLISVYCFFAALASVVILRIVLKNSRAETSYTETQRSVT
jgi:hypothetical protein